MLLFVLCRVWMDGPMSEVIPDVVEQEVGNSWRTLYKLEKGFADVPAAKKIASKVRNHNQYETNCFQEYLPPVSSSAFIDERKRDGRCVKLTNFFCFFFAIMTWFFNLSKIALFFLPHSGKHINAKFGENRSRYD